MVGGCVLEASTKLLAAPGVLVQTVLVIAWTATAAKRLVDWRHGKSRVLTLEGGSQALAVVAGMAPWFMLLMDGAFHSLSPLDSFTFPPVFRFFGAILIICGILGPFRVAGRRGRAPAHAGGFAYAFGFLLLSSPVIGVLATGCWLAMSYCVQRESRIPAPSFA